MELGMRLAHLLTRWRPFAPPGHIDEAGGAPDRAQLAETVRRIIALGPHLRNARRCEARLEQAAAVALRYVSGIAVAIPPEHEASAAAWSLDPYIHAFFGAPDAIAPALSRSRDLRAFFDENPDLEEAHAVLGMAMREKHMLGTALEGEMLRRDVVQETISFSDHQVRICGRSEPDLREEIVRRMVVQLGLQGMARYAEQQSRRGLLERERALLNTRLRLLARKGVGMHALVGGDRQAADAGELARLQDEIAENESALQQLGLRSDALDHELAQVCAVMQDPSAHLSVQTRRCVLNKMNVVLPPGRRDEGEEVAFQVAQVPAVPPQARAFTLVRFARADLLPPGGMLDEAVRLLG